MAALSAPRRRAGGREYVLAPKLGCTLVCGENARASGLLGRIQAVRPFAALSDAEKRDVLGPRGDDMVQLQLYELRNASRDGVARLDLTRRLRWVAAAAIESTILVVHDAHTRDGTVPLPLEGVAGAYVIDRVERSPVTAKKWKSIPGPRTADDLDWRLELRRIVYGLLAEDIHVVGTSGVGYSAASLSCSENDWAVIQQIFMDSAAGGEAPRVRKGRGETRSWSLNPTNVMFTRSSCATRRITLEFVTPDQLERVGACIGPKWNVATCRRTLDSQKRIEIGLEDPLQHDVRVGGIEVRARNVFEQLGAPRLAERLGRRPRSHHRAVGAPRGLAAAVLQPVDQQLLRAFERDG